MGACVITPVGARSENAAITGATPGERLIRVEWVDVELSADYGPAGDTCDLSGTTLASKVYCASQVGRVASVTDNLEFRFQFGPSDNPALARIRAIVSSTGLEVAPGVDLSGETIRLAVEGY